MKARKLFKKRYKGKLKFVKKKRKNFRKRWNIYIYIYTGGEERSKMSLPVYEHLCGVSRFAVTVIWISRESPGLLRFPLDSALRFLFLHLHFTAYSGREHATLEEKSIHVFHERAKREPTVFLETTRKTSIRFIFAYAEYEHRFKFPLEMGFLVQLNSKFRHFSI